MIPLDQEIRIVLVHRVYLLRLSMMTTDDQFSRTAASTSADEVGKVFDDGWHHPVKSWKLPSSLASLRARPRVLKRGSRSQVKWGATSRPHRA
jgi:hypothetical protein